MLFRDAMRYPDEFKMLQTGIPDYTPDMLREHCPLVIQDGVVDSGILISTCMRFQFLWSTDVPSLPTFWKKSMSKFVLVHNASKEDTIIGISHPRNSNAVTQWRALTGLSAFLIAEAENDIPRVDVVLHPWQSVIIPCNWIWRSGQNTKETALTDLTHAAIACVTRVSTKAPS